MEKEPKKIFKITRGDAECYIVNEPVIPFDIKWRENPTKKDKELFWDLRDAYYNLPGGDYDFFTFCSNHHGIHEEEARKFVQWLRDNRDWNFEAEYICPYSNEQCENRIPENCRL